MEFNSFWMRRSCKRVAAIAINQIVLQLPQAADASESHTTSIPPRRERDHQADVEWRCRRSSPAALGKDITYKLANQSGEFQGTVVYTS